MIYIDFSVEKLALSGNRWKPLYYGLFGDLGHKYSVCHVYRGGGSGLDLLYNFYTYSPYKLHQLERVFPFILGEFNVCRIDRILSECRVHARL